VRDDYIVNPAEAPRREGAKKRKKKRRKRVKKCLKAADIMQKESKKRCFGYELT
jgi:hypothetical protein